MIRKIKTGWEVDFYPEGRTGRRIRKRGFKTRLDAVAWLRRVEQKGSGAGRRLSDLVKYWHDHHGCTLKDADQRFSRLKGIVSRLHDPLTVDFTSSDWMEYRITRLKQVKASTVNHEQRYMKAVFSECVRLGVIQENPIAKVRQVKEQHHEMMFLNLEQCGHLLTECEASTNNHTWCVAAICLATGARWGEAEGLTHSSWLPGKVIFKDTKNGKDRAVPIMPELQEQIKPRLRPGPGRLFDSCRSAFRSAYDRCGFQTPQQLTHILRHTFASHYMMNGGDLLTLQRILGHGSITMTMRYAHLAPNHLESALRFSPMTALCRQDVVNM